ncbi:MAG TPA: DNA-formamidopyrimidine glycosylase family protein [Acidimicrobiia bacterium]|nr:DNA-formamidopyrimidine glycosylase family protein [Acidimicrobiia bacterium]
MPELPDIVVYLEALQRRVAGRTIRGFRVVSPSVLRTFEPPYAAIVGREVVGLRRIGKRIVWDLSDGSVIVIHLMVAGRLKWSQTIGVAVPRKVGLCAWDFDDGTLILTEQGTKRRAGVWIFGDAATAAEEDRGGVEPLEVTAAEFATALRRENRTLKRALTDPRIFSGIGNAFSDEILWEAGLSPVKRTSQLDSAEIELLHAATRASLIRWTDLLRESVGDGWPDKVTAFRPEMAVHGKYGEPCPRCGSKVQRIVYASNETNYCATCQTGGRLLADRSLSRLLKDDWPATLEDLEDSRS